MEYNNELLNSLLEKHKLSGGQLAKMLNCSKSTISRLRSGNYPTKGSSSVLKEIVNVLGKKGVENAKDILTPPTPKLKKYQEVTQMLSTKILKHFHLKNNPFSSEIPLPHKVWVNEEIEGVEDAMFNASMNQEFLLVAGEVGSGKSTILRKVLRKLEREEKVKVSIPPKYLVEKITSVFIVDTMIQDFGGDDPFRSHRRRARQLKEIITRNYNDNIKQILIIDEAQGLHPNTLRALKRFWEGIGSGTPMVSIILIGQPYIYSTLSSTNLSEVKLRLNMIELEPFTSRNGNLSSYIKHKILVAGGSENLFSEKAAAAISKRAKTPLQVNVMCKNALIEAARIQEMQVSEEIIAQI